MQVLFVLTLVVALSLTNAFAPRSHSISRSTALKNNSDNDASPTFTTIKNVRDVATVSPALLRPGRLFRCGTPSNANLDDKNNFIDTLGIKTLVDLRSVTELKEDELVEDGLAYEGFTDVLWKRRTGARIIKKAGRSIRKLKGLKRSVDNFGIDEGDDDVEGDFLTVNNLIYFNIYSCYRCRNRSWKKKSNELNTAARGD